MKGDETRLNKSKSVDNFTGENWDIVVYTLPGVLADRADSDS